MKKVVMIFLTVCMLAALFVPINAKNTKIPEFKALEEHNLQVLGLFIPDDSESAVMFATLLNKKTAERKEYVVSDIYSWQDNYTDAIFFYESANPDWNSAVHLDLLNNVFSFSLSQPMKRGEELAVIFDDGSSVWIEYVTQKNFHNNMYSIKDVYVPDYINAKVIAYNEELNEYDVPMRYAYVLAEQNVDSDMPSSGNTITSFTFKGQAGETVIDNLNNTITIFMPYGTDLSKLVPVITYSSKALVYPSVSAKVDFSKKVSYTVVAEDNSKTTYTLKVIVLDKTPVTYQIPYYPPYIYDWHNHYTPTWHNHKNCNYAWCTVCTNPYYNYWWYNYNFKKCP